MRGTKYPDFSQIGGKFERKKKHPVLLEMFVKFLKYVQVFALVPFFSLNL